MTGVDMMQAMVETLSNFHQNLLTQEDVKKIELEVRVGLLVDNTNKSVRYTHGIPGSGVFVDKAGTKFVSGVSHRDYESMKQQIGEIYNKEISTHVSSYSYPQHNRRVIFDEEALTLPFSETKEKIQTVDIMIPAASYDLRFQTSLETYQGNESGTDPPTGWNCKRTKRRVSWISSEKAKYWKADLTFVETSGSITSNTWEVELELLPEVMVEWISNPNIKINIASELFTILEEINPTDQPDGETPTAESRVIENEVHETLKNKFGGTFRKLFFPGTMPVSMRKRHVPGLQRSTSYRIAEKTDGVRYLMMTIQNTCVLVDRSKQVFKVDGGQVLFEILGADTIIDGELVYNRTLNKSIFVAFDVLKLRGVDQMTKKFTIREKEIINLIQEYEEANVQTQHLELKMKTFYHKNEIMKLFRNIDERRIFKDSKGMHHKTDGIIFQPDSPYKTGTDENLLKWKWEDLASLDLRVRMHGKSDIKIYTYAGEGDVEVEVDLSGSVKLSIQDRARLIADMKVKGIYRNVEDIIADMKVKGKVKGFYRNWNDADIIEDMKVKEIYRNVYRDVYRNGTTKRVFSHTTILSYAIAEMALDSTSGLWVYMGIRPEKTRINKPNFITTVMSTMVEVAEGLSEEELKYRMLSDPSSDDWVTQEMAMRKLAVKWKYGKSNK